MKNNDIKIKYKLRIVDAKENDIPIKNLVMFVKFKEKGNWFYTTISKVLVTSAYYEDSCTSGNTVQYNNIQQFLMTVENFSNDEFFLKNKANGIVEDYLEGISGDEWHKRVLKNVQKGGYKHVN